MAHHTLWGQPPPNDGDEPRLGKGLEPTRKASALGYGVQRRGKVLGKGQWDLLRNIERHPELDPKKQGLFRAIVICRR